MRAPVDVGRWLDSWLGTSDEEGREWNQRIEVRCRRGLGLLGRESGGIVRLEESIA